MAQPPAPAPPNGVPAPVPGAPMAPNGAAPAVYTSSGSYAPGYVGPPGMPGMPTTPGVTVPGMASPYDPNYAAMYAAGAYTDPNYAAAMAAYGQPPQMQPVPPAGVAQGPPQQYYAAHQQYYPQYYPVPQPNQMGQMAPPPGSYYPPPAGTYPMQMPMQPQYAPVPGYVPPPQYYGGVPPVPVGALPSPPVPQIPVPGVEQGALAAFAHADVERKGNVDVKGFIEAVKAFGVVMEYKEMLKYFEMADEDTDGQIAREEFVQLCRLQLGHRRQHNSNRPLPIPQTPPASHQSHNMQQHHMPQPQHQMPHAPPQHQPPRQ